MIFLTAPQVAARLGYGSATTFRKDRTRLERDLSFPAPMPTCKRPLKWRADAIMAWLTTQGTTVPYTTLHTPPDPALMKEARLP